MTEVWWKMMRKKGLRRGFAESLRWLADRVAREDAFVGGCSSFYFKEGAGIVYDETGRRGTPLWFRASDYERAHSEGE